MAPSLAVVTLCGLLSLSVLNFPADLGAANHFEAMIEDVDVHRILLEMYQMKGCLRLSRLDDGCHFECRNLVSFQFIEYLTWLMIHIVSSEDVDDRFVGVLSER